MTDKHANYSHLLLKANFSTVHGLQLTLTLEKQPKIPVNNTSHYLQIVFCKGNHWITVSTIGYNKNCVSVYDSLYSSTGDTTMKLFTSYLEKMLMCAWPLVQSKMELMTVVFL